MVLRALGGTFRGSGDTAEEVLIADAVIVAVTVRPAPGDASEVCADVPGRARGVLFALANVLDAITAQARIASAAVCI